MVRTKNSGCGHQWESSTEFMRNTEAI